MFQPAKPVLLVSLLLGVWIAPAPSGQRRRSRCWAPAEHWATAAPVSGQAVAATRDETGARRSQASPHRPSSRRSRARLITARSSHGMGMGPYLHAPRL